jgi:hypothetical protein
VGQELSESDRSCAGDDLARSRAGDLDALVVPEIAADLGLGEIGLPMHQAAAGAAELLSDADDVESVALIAGRKIRRGGKRTYKNKGREHNVPRFVMWPSSLRFFMGEPSPDI